MLSPPRMVDKKEGEITSKYAMQEGLHMDTHRPRENIYPTADSFGLGIMPVLFSWLTPEVQQLRSRYLVELGRNREDASGTSAHLEIH
ncbi:MAG: hypothetical protein R6U70_03885 [Bacillota bacterium]